MYLYTLRWRLRCQRNLHKRGLHLIDSQVALAVAVKGRSSSRELNQLLRPISSIQVCCDHYPLLEFIASADNPADAASRLYDHG